MYLVDQVKLAEVLGVTKAAVSQAIKGKRLLKSVTKTASGRYKIDLAPAILEWFNNADQSKIRDDSKRHPLIEVKDLMEIERSRQLKEHYQSLLEKLEYEKQTNTILDRDKTEKELFEVFRAVRDKLLGIPTKYPDDFRDQLKDEIEKALEELASDNINLTDN